MCSVREFSASVSTHWAIRWASLFVWSFETIFSVTPIKGSEELGGAKIKKRPGKPKKEAKEVSAPVDDEVADPLIVDRILSHRTVKRSKR